MHCTTSAASPSWFRFCASWSGRLSVEGINRLGTLCLREVFQRGDIEAGFELFGRIAVLFGKVQQELDLLRTCGCINSPNTATGCRFNDATDKTGGLWGCLNGTVQISRQGAGSTTPPTKVGGLWGLSQWDCPNIATRCKAAMQRNSGFCYNCLD